MTTPKPVKQDLSDGPIINPELHSLSDVDVAADVVIAPDPEKPGWTGAPQDLIGCTVTFRGAKSAAGIVETWAQVPDKGLVVVVGGKQYLAADIVVVQPQQ